MRQQGYEGKMVVHSPYKLKNLLKLTMVKLEKLKEKKVQGLPRKTFKIYANKCTRHSNSAIKLFIVHPSIDKHNCF
jgi:hypothetical protein